MKISEKCAGVAPSMTLSITSKANAMKSEGYDVISFSAGEPDFNTPKHVADAAIAAIHAGKTKYTPASGIAELKQAVANQLAKQGLSYKPSQIVISNGAKHSLYNAMVALLEDGDEVLIPVPYWLSYPELVKLAGGVPVYVQTGSNFLASIDNFKEKLTAKTRALILTNPSNPTGAIYSTKQLKEIAEFCVANDIIVISDEIYDQLVYDGKCPPSIATFDNMIDRTIVINGASKSYAMTGWRIGWAAAPQNVASAMGAFQSHATSNPNTIAQWAALEALTNPKTEECIADMNKAFKERRDYMAHALDEMKHAEYVKPDGAFYVMVDVSKTYGKEYNGKKIEGSLDFASILLEEKYVATIPGIVFGSDDYIRLSYAASMENIKMGLNRLNEFLNEIMA